MVMYEDCSLQPRPRKMKNKMNEIIVLDKAPIIFTKDKEWVELFNPRTEPGSIIILPQDAVLVVAPTKETTQEKE